MDSVAAPSFSVHLIHPDDDVGVALETAPAGALLRVGAAGLNAIDEIPRGHKVALRAIVAGAPVRKYGFAIGAATQAIAPGAHVHSHNLATQLGGVEHYEYTPPAPVSLPRTQASFRGYRRADGRVGTRNEIWILSTVGCVTRTAQRLAKLGEEAFADRIDGVHAFTHPFGCSQLGDDLDRTRKLLAALAAHPNAGGVLILGLGCENNQLDALVREIPDLDRTRLRSFAAQAEGDEIEAGMAALEELVAFAENDRREDCPLAALVIGLKCGGSDGFSGLTVNPLVGAIADRVASAGGTPVLTEVPEMFGAERLLMARAKDETVFANTVTLVNNFKGYFTAHGQPVHENPSPGNKAGGITTLEEKSLGAIQKGGRSPVTQVLRYGDRTRAPGADGVSSTALVAAGATILLFTTGRGTPLGFPAPTLKISSNTALAEKKRHWIDFDAGRLLARDSFDAAADALFLLVLETASGAPAYNEQNDEREIAIWKDGVTL